jgi:RNA polymerase sigma factor FliA
MNTTEIPSDPNALVESHLYLVQHVVNQVASRYPRHIDRSELWSAGAAGLVDASRRFDPGTGVPFARYASIRIRGAIIDSTRTRDWATRSLRRDMRQLASAASDFEQDHGRSASTRELAEQLGLDVEDVAARQSAAQAASLLHLDQPVGPGAEDGTFGDRIPEQAPHHLPDEAAEQQELVGTVRIAVELLPDTQRRVVEAYFFEGRLLRDIADELGVTEARISQIRSEALTAIQAYFAEAFAGVPAVPQDAPGVRRRSAFVANVISGSTWRSRFEAGQQPSLEPLAATAAASGAA